MQVCLRLWTGQHKLWSTPDTLDTGLSPTCFLGFCLTKDKTPSPGQDSRGPERPAPCSRPSPRSPHTYLFSLWTLAIMESQAGCLFCGGGGQRPWFLHLPCLKGVWNLQDWWDCKKCDGERISVTRTLRGQEMEGWAFLVIGLGVWREAKSRQNKSWCPQCLAAWGIV